MRQTILPSPSIIIHTNNRCDSSQSISMHEYSNYSGDRADQMMECQLVLEKVPSEGSKSRRRPLLGPSPG